MLAGAVAGIQSRIRRAWTRTARPLLVLAVALAGIRPSAGDEPSWSEVEDLFARRCLMCHSGDHAARGLHLDTPAGALAGGDRGAVVVPGDPAGSELIRRIQGRSRPRMPFLSTPLSPEDVALLERWVAAGAPGRRSCP